jgi:hypothetical protein
VIEKIPEMYVEFMVAVGLLSILVVAFLTETFRSGRFCHSSSFRFSMISIVNGLDIKDGKRNDKRDFKG